MQETVLELKNYSVSFDTPDGEVQAVRNVDLTVKKGEILCIVGESGCGKTVMCRSVMKLLPPNAHVKSGEISLCGENITAYKEKKWKAVRKQGKHGVPGPYADAESDDPGWQTDHRGYYKNRKYPGMRRKKELWKC